MSTEHFIFRDFSIVVLKRHSRPGRIPALRANRPERGFFARVPFGRRMTFSTTFDKPCLFTDNSRLHPIKGQQLTGQEGYARLPTGAAPNGGALHRPAPNH